MNISFEYIKSLLPQDSPFIFIDAVTDIECNKKIECYKNISYNEYFFQGHFKQEAIFPGVLITEAMAQSSILLYKLSNVNSNLKNKFLLTSDKTKFLNVVKPGDKMVIQTEIVKKFENSVFVKSVAMVDGIAVSTSELSFYMAEY